MLQNILTSLLVTPLLGVILLSFISSKQRNLLKVIALNFSSLPFLGFLIVWVGFKEHIVQFQFSTKIYWLHNFYFVLGIDGISLFFLLLTTLLIPICILVSWDSMDKKFLKEYLISFLLLEFFLIGVFCILDVLLFYIFFESVLIPMYLIVGV